MQQQIIVWSVVKLLAAIIQHIHHTVCSVCVRTLNACEQSFKNKNQHEWNVTLPSINLNRASFYICKFDFLFEWINACM